VLKKRGAVLIFPPLFEEKYFFGKVFLYDNKETEVSSAVYRILLLFQCFFMDNEETKVFLLFTEAFFLLFKFSKN